MKMNNFFIIFLMNYILSLTSMSLDFPKLTDAIKGSIKRACDKKYKKKFAECAIAEVLVEEFVNKDSKNLNSRDNLKRTLLIYSVICGPYEIVKYLIEKKADIDAQDSKGWNALMHAVELKRSDVVKLLMKYGPDVTKKNIDGQSVFDLLWQESKEISK